MRLTKMSFDTPDLRLVDDNGDGDEPMPATAGRRASASAATPTSSPR